MRHCLEGLASRSPDLRNAGNGFLFYTGATATLCCEELHPRAHGTGTGRRFDRDTLLDCVKQTLGAMPRGTIIPMADTPTLYAGLSLCRKKFEQISLELAMPGLPLGDSRRYAMMLLNFIVGGGSSSRLFQRLREELGLAYSVYSTSYSQNKTGLFTVSAAVSPDQQQRVLAEIRDILREVPGSITEQEFLRARAQVKSSYILGLETVAARASYAGRCELLDGRILDSEEVLRLLDALTIADVSQLAEDILYPKQLALAVAGAIQSKKLYIPHITV